MNEHELDRVLEEIGREQLPPPPGLVGQTCRRMRRNRLLPLLIGLGIGSHLLTIGALQLYLLAAPVSPLHQAMSQIGLGIIGGIVAVLVLAARRRAQSLLHRLEAAAGSR